MHGTFKSPCALQPGSVIIKRGAREIGKNDKNKAIYMAGLTPSRITGMAFVF